MRRASALLWTAIAACASATPRAKVAALGWSLGGEAHVFVSGNRVARDWYRRMTGSEHLGDSLQRRPLIAVEERRGAVATVLSGSGAAPARVTLVRFHAAGTCGPAEPVVELVLAFPPGVATHRTAPPSHVSVVALVGGAPFSGGAGTASPTLSPQESLDLIAGIARIAEPRAPLVAPLALDPDRAADAGEVVALQRGRYAVGFRARVQSGNGDTVLVTGVAETGPRLRDVRWIIRPTRARLTGGMIDASSGSVRRYSLRGSVAGPESSPLLLLDEIADRSAHDSRASAIDPSTRRSVASLPLALRCP